MWVNFTSFEELASGKKQRIAEYSRYDRRNPIFEFFLHENNDDVSYCDFLNYIKSVNLT